MLDILHMFLDQDVHATHNVKMTEGIRTIHRLQLLDQVTKNS